jgi:hypothetical protein
LPTSASQGDTFPGGLHESPNEGARRDHIGGHQRDSSPFRFLHDGRLLRASAKPLQPTGTSSASDTTGQSARSLRKSPAAALLDSLSATTRPRSARKLLHGLRRHLASYFLRCATGSTSDAASRSHHAATRRERFRRAANHTF